jgi:hypothetical protein
MSQLIQESLSFSLLVDFDMIRVEIILILVESILGKHVGIIPGSIHFDESRGSPVILGDNLADLLFYCDFRVECVKI